MVSLPVLFFKCAPKSAIYSNTLFRCAPDHGARPRCLVVDRSSSVSSSSESVNTVLYVSSNTFSDASKLLPVSSSQRWEFVFIRRYLEYCIVAPVAAGPRAGAGACAPIRMRVGAARAHAANHQERRSKNEARTLRSLAYLYHGSTADYPHGHSCS